MRNFPHGERREGSENMSGKRQPTALVEANGRKHLTQAEADERRDREIYMPPADEVTPPKWLPKRLRPEYCEIGEMLNGAGLYAELDRDVLGQYFLCRERWTKADKKAAAAISKNDEKLAKEWTSIQGAYFKQARQCAELPDRCSDRSCQRGGCGCRRSEWDGRIHQNAPPPSGQRLEQERKQWLSDTIRSPDSLSATLSAGCRRPIPANFSTCMTGSAAR